MQKKLAHLIIFSTSEPISSSLTSCDTLRRQLRSARLSHSLTWAQDGLLGRELLISSTVNGGNSRIDSV